MSETGYPKEITKDNVEELKERTTKIKKRAFRSLIYTTVLYGIIGLTSLPFIFFYVGVFLLNILPKMPSETFFGIFLVVFVIVFEVFLYFLLNIIELTLKRVLKFPRYEERIFAQCFLIAYYLKKNERTKAMKEVDDFIAHLSVFAKDFFNYPKGKMYAPKFNLLISGRDQIKRMLFFSDVNVSETLTSFGLSLVHNEDQEAYSSLKRIIEETQKYGKLEGRFQRILGGMEKHQTAMTLIIWMASIVLAIIGIRS